MSGKKKSERRFSAAQKFEILQEGEYGSMSINEVCRRHGISTVYLLSLAEAGPRGNAKGI